VPDHAAAKGEAHVCPGSHAVVIGAGPAGVAAALALAARTERVTLIDRADVPGPEWEARPKPAAVRDVLASPQVVVRAGLEVVGFVLVSDIRRSAGGRRERRPDGTPSRIGGVLVRPRRAGAGVPTEIVADVVVDARGPVAIAATLAAWSGRTTRRGRGHAWPRPVDASSAAG
jgi:hypothetical protein